MSKLEELEAKMNIVFLDYDGVVNTLWFKDFDSKPNYNYPEDNCVNNTQAICWLNKLCKEFNAKIVVTSTWRLCSNYKECLFNAGLDKDIEIIGKTENLGTGRGYEIKDWLKKNRDLNIEHFVILDDESGGMIDLVDHLVLTDTYLGLTMYSYEEAKRILSILEV